MKAYFKVKDDEKTKKKKYVKTKHCPFFLLWTNNCHSSRILCQYWNAFVYNQMFIYNSIFLLLRLVSVRWTRTNDTSLSFSITLQTQKYNILTSGDLLICVLG